MTVPNDIAVRRALEAVGVEFIDENGDGRASGCGSGCRRKERKDTKRLRNPMALVWQRCGRRTKSGAGILILRGAETQGNRLPCSES